MRPSLLRGLLLLLVAVLTTAAFAHPANVPYSLAKVAPDGTFSIRIRFDALAFATGASPKDADDDAMNALLDGPETALRDALANAAGQFRRGFVIGNGGQIDHLDFPTVAAVRRFLAADPDPRLPVMLEASLRGRLPKGARTISFRYPATFGTVIQTVEFPYNEPISEPVEPGASSRTLNIPSSEEIATIAAALNRPRAEEPKPTSPPKPVEKKPEAAPEKAPPLPKAEQKTEQNPAPKPEPVKPQPVEKTPPPVVAPSTPEVRETPLAAVVDTPPASPSSPVAIYLKMGFTHILPEGLDHILFVLGLFLLGSNTKALLKQITAFTVAHSITLALATLGLVHLPGRIIEPLIALSIAFVAAENLWTKEVKPTRTAVVFLFGLIHGMGFAEVFADAGLRGSGLVTALLSFNVGVELGQLAVIAMALGVVGWFRQDQRYRKVVVVPASAFIAALALFWTVERIFS